MKVMLCLCLNPLGSAVFVYGNVWGGAGACQFETLLNILCRPGMCRIPATPGPCSSRVGRGVDGIDAVCCLVLIEW
jgi:hypothetical protein